MPHLASQSLSNSDTPVPSVSLGKSHTPMMTQYLGIKERYPDTLLFYRMGDFYELFFDDAVKASTILDITLTKRGKTDETDIPMCGVPAHAYEPYLAKLIRAGYRVAICDQTETPEEARARGGYKALVARDVIRVVTPGTLTEETLLDARSPNYLASIVRHRGETALAWLDLSTGDFHTQNLSDGQLPTALARVAPREIVISDRLYQQDDIAQTCALFDRAVTRQPDSLFDSDNARHRLQNYFGTQTLDIFGTFTTAEITAASVILDYTERTQKAAIMHVRPPQNVHADDIIQIDGATRRNLELVETLAGERRGSLLATIDKTLTAGGGRLLYTRLMAPVCHAPTLHDRHDQIEFFVCQKDVRDHLRDHLKTVPDLERALARLALGRGSPRDLAAVMNSLCAAADLLHGLNSRSDLNHALENLMIDLRQNPDLQHLHDTLKNALADTLPPQTQDGNFIRNGYDAGLDSQRQLRDQGRRMIVALQQKYAGDTGVETLKISHNNILGYYIDVTAKRADILFSRPEIFIHRQTLAGNIRFTTTELASLERDLNSAAERALALELILFKTLVDQVLNLRPDLTRVATAIAALDVATALAHLASTENYTRPLITNDLSFKIVAGRHPVVEQALQNQDQPFIANDTDLSPDQRLWLMTGPNMAGKSTILRQNALIIILAQMGSFVPAAQAEIGLVDRLFSRVGASDDLARGRSTFMVEMVETAAILHQTTAKSFVILDEIGRGTATYDGLSIAWACLEYLHDQIACRGLFATHYHELTELKNRLNHLHVAHMAVKKWEDNIVFLHRIEPGAAEGSYGIHVARLAGLPAIVIARASEVLETLNNREPSTNTTATNKSDHALASLPLFSTKESGHSLVERTEHALVQRMQKINPDDLSPRDALELIYELKKLI